MRKHRIANFEIEMVPRISVYSEDPKRKFLASPTAVTFIIYCEGYALIWIDRRCLWPIYLLLFLMGFFLIEEISSIGENSSPDFVRRFNIHHMLLILLIFSFLLYPVKESSENIVFNADKGVYFLSRDLHGKGIQGRIASNDNWTDTLFLAYYLNTPYYGVIPDSVQTWKTLEEYPKRSNVNYYFEWSTIPTSMYRRATPCSRSFFKKLRALICPAWGFIV